MLLHASSSAPTSIRSEMLQKKAGLFNWWAPEEERLYNYFQRNQDPIWILFSKWPANWIHFILKEIWCKPGKGIWGVRGVRTMIFQWLKQSCTMGDSRKYLYPITGSISLNPPVALEIPKHSAPPPSTCTVHVPSMPLEFHYHSCSPHKFLLFLSHWFNSRVKICSLSLSPSLCKVFHSEKKSFFTV